MFSPHKNMFSPHKNAKTFFQFFFKGISSKLALVWLTKHEGNAIGCSSCRLLEMVCAAGQDVAMKVLTSVVSHGAAAMLGCCGAVGAGVRISVAPQSSQAHGLSSIRILGNIR